MRCRKRKILKTLKGEERKEYVATKDYGIQNLQEQSIGFGSFGSFGARRCGPAFGLFGLRRCGRRQNVYQRAASPTRGEGMGGKERASELCNAAVFGRRQARQARSGRQLARKVRWRAGTDLTNGGRRGLSLPLKQKSSFLFVEQ